MLVTNPNPDRARRAAAPAPAADGPTQAVAPTTAVIPAPAPAAAATPRVAATATGVFGIMPARATGLQQTQVSERKRTVDARHDDPAWQCVEITEDTNNPRWRCLGCGEGRSGSATKVVDHLLGRNRTAACNLSKATRTRITRETSERGMSRRWR